ncbi:hypothetical protein J2Y38_001057 [Flavobacterium sp. 2755]|uniref:hypothetical protein n=1 Tax=Flavobacterium sp. 2755 TaxID=2817765 RepID=UPI002855DBE4|nr:hypothetical protein [Flavobacterium sp. 2755]MDR6760859.1 hypothetical protein [Flavobacterium sp. 2755]
MFATNYTNFHELFIIIKLVKIRVIRGEKLHIVNPTGFKNLSGLSFTVSSKRASTSLSLTNVIIELSVILSDPEASGEGL